MKKLLLLDIIFIMGINVLWSGCQQQESKGSPLTEKEKESVEVRPEVIFTVADDQPIYQYVESQGVVEANQSVQLKTKVSGYVDRSYITEGRWVQKGDTLLVLDRREYAMAVDEAQNAYREARQKYDIEMNMRAKQDREAKTDGKRKNGQSLVRIATGLAQAELDLKQAQLNLSYAALLAPFTGVLSTDQRLAEGTYVSAGVRVGQLVDVRTVRIRFSLLESELSKVSRHMTARLTAPGGERLQGKVEAIDPVVDAESKTGTVIVQSDNAGGILMPGMTVEGRLQIVREEGKVRIPRSAILSRDGGRTLVFKLHPNTSEVEWIYVHPTAENSDWALVDNPGIEPGDTIAVDKHFALSHLQKVAPKMQNSELDPEANNTGIEQ